MPTGSGRVSGVEYASMPKDIQDRIWGYMDHHEIPYVKWVTLMAGVDVFAWNTSVKRLRTDGKASCQKKMLDAMLAQLESPPDFSKTPRDHMVTHKPTTKKLINDVIALRVEGLPAGVVANRLNICTERLYKILRENIRPISEDKLHDMLLLSGAGVSMEYICARLNLTSQEVKHYRKEEL